MVKIKKAEKLACVISLMLAQPNQLKPRLSRTSPNQMELFVSYLQLWPLLWALIHQISLIIHWSPPTDAELYVQETGRDGQYSKAVLYYNNYDISKSSYVQDSMKMYCENAIECRRSMLMNQFEQSPSFERPRFLHQCCDVYMYETVQVFGL